MATSISTPAGAGAGRTWLGHPRGLFLLFFVEMWERFSFYGMRALLIFYLTQHFLFSDRDASYAYGAYMSLIYISPLMGGYLADRYLGQRKAVLFGGVVIAAGHIILGMESDDAGAMGLGLFWLGLATVITGTGFLKSSVSALVGQLYPRDDMRRDPAYTIFYMGINLGATIGPVICGYLGQTWGWHWGFGAASVGMIAGVIGFMLCRPLLQGKGEPRDPERLRQRVGGILSREWLVYLSSLAFIALCWFLIQNHVIVGWMLAAASVAVVLYILWEAFGRMERIGRDRMLAALFLLVINPLFWGLYEQTGSSLSLFTDRYTDRNIWGFNVPASMFQSVNAAYILMFGPVMAGLWIWLAKRGWEPSTPAKFGIALALVGAGFLILVAGTGAPGTLTPVLFIFLLYLCHTLGELCLSPVGLSAMSKLAPSRMIGLMMGIWFLAMALGEYAAGLIAAATGGEGGAASRGDVLAVYGRIGWWSVGAGLVVMALAPLVKRLMHADRFDEEGE
ncbi:MULTISPECIES: peptide MFS transporter [Sphingobium]|uniref:MFS transporter n=1 Tax=Sphingobium fuliginis (strain ATCC 27551) TaxID=336203 RepID=A0ABQ1FBB2_SPHSA|nr:MULTISPECIES: peptide MFS transporter [Sphingobium]OAP32859.1 MFS transporter [Sphingobium sp. 20006FA]AJR25756.1 MFS transporter [Sphingobium sp. YBL2]KXU32475.1 MFS transporter [Sphingobium sp. AM]KYC32532.1 MFS transporter [Sphingobium sp. 22B]RYL96044.1 peptide MFS transporter [Sphingobium fuliginis]